MTLATVRAAFSFATFYLNCVVSGHVRGHAPKNESNESQHTHDAHRKLPRLVSTRDTTASKRDRIFISKVENRKFHIAGSIQQYAGCHLHIDSIEGVSGVDLNLLLLLPSFMRLKPDDAVGPPSQQ